MEKPNNIANVVNDGVCDASSATKNTNNIAPIFSLGQFIHIAFEIGISGQN